MNGTLSPTVSPVPSAAPSETPKPVTIPATQDAMLRGGEFANYRFGKDPFLALRGNRRKVILEFDLSSARPNYEYQYTLQFFVTFVDANEQRSVTASYITQQDYEWSEFDINWNNFGEPSMTEIGWFSIFKSDAQSLVEIPIGNLFNSTVANNRFILVLENDSAETGGDKFDFRSTEFADAFQGMPDTPPTLVGVPQFDEE